MSSRAPSYRPMAMWRHIWSNAWMGLSGRAFGPYAVRVGKPPCWRVHACVCGASPVLNAVAQRGRRMSPPLPFPHVPVRQRPDPCPERRADPSRRFNLNISTAHPSEMLWQQLHFSECDVSEMSTSLLVMAIVNGDTRWVAIPVCLICTVYVRLSGVG